MSRLHWQTSRTIVHNGISLPVAENLPITIGPEAGFRQVGGIRPNTARQLRLKRLAWPMTRLHNALLVTGFLERALGRWMRQRLRDDTVFLEIGAGDMAMRRYLPRRFAYNPLDIAFSEFALRRVMAARDGDRINPVLASACDIPLPDGAANLIISKEVMMYVPDVEQALREIRRVCAPVGGAFMCTIGNLHSRKYARKGWQGGFATAMSFDQFRALGERCGFRCAQALQRGWWIPLPSWISDTTHQLPITSKREFDNTNFLYLFEAI